MGLFNQFKRFFKRHVVIQNAIRPVTEGLEDRALLAANAVQIGTDLYITGTGGADSISLLRSSSTIKVGLNGVLKTFDNSSIDQIYLDAYGGDDSIVLSSSITKPVAVNAGGDSDVLYLNGTTGANTINLTATSVTLSNSQSATLTNAFAQVYLDGRGGDDVVILDDNVSATIRYSQKLQSLTLGNDAIVNLAAGSASTVRLKSVPVLGTNAFVNVNDNAMIVDYTGGSSPYSALRTQLGNGLGLLGGTQTNGIGSIEVDLQNAPGTFLTIVDNGAISGAIDSRSFDNNIPADSVIIIYTWFGDSDLNGVVDASDYALIDTGVNPASGVSGWVFGDYDLDGDIDGDEYALIDTGFISQQGNPQSLWASSPSDVEVEAISSSEIKLEWTAADSFDIGDYYMIFATEDGDNYQLVGTTTNTTFQCYSHFNGSVQFKVAAHIGTLVSPAKTAQAISGGDAELSLSKAIADADWSGVTDTTITLNWTESATSVTGYRITFTPVDENGEGQSTTVIAQSSELTRDGTSVTYELTGLEAETTYNIKIQPFNDNSSTTSGTSGMMLTNSPGGSNNNAGGAASAQAKTAPPPSPGRGTIYNLGSATPYYVKAKWSKNTLSGLKNETVSLTLNGLPKHAYIHVYSLINATEPLSQDDHADGHHADMELKADGNVIDWDEEYHAPSGGYYGTGNWHDDWHTGDIYEHEGDSLTLEIKGSNFSGSNYSWWVQSFFVDVIMPGVDLNLIQGSAKEGDTTIPEEGDTPGNVLKWQVVRNMYGAQKFGMSVSLESLLDGSTANDADAAKLPASINFAGVSNGVVDTVRVINIPVANDTDAEWTETYLAKVGDGGENYIANPLILKADIGDDDVKVEITEDLMTVNNDDSDDDGIIDLEDTDGTGSDDRLYEANLKFPTGGRGGEVRLHLGGFVKAWTSQSRTGEILSGSLNPPETVYLEAIGGSSTLNDVLATLIVMDAAATQVADPNPRIQFNDGKGGAVGVDMTINTKRQGHFDMIIGQGVTAATSVLGPATIKRTDYIIGGDAIEDYIVTRDLGQVVELDGGDLIWTDSQQYPGSNQTHFYWKSKGTGNSINSSSRLLLSSGEYLQLDANTSVNVLEPVAELAVTQLRNGPEYFGGGRWGLGNVDDPANYGITFKAKVDGITGMDNEGYHGHFEFLQIIESTSTQVNTHDGKTFVGEYDQYSNMVDNFVFYPSDEAINWVGNGYSHTSDSPALSGLNFDPFSPNYTESGSTDVQFKMYIYYQGPDLTDSIYVPLKCIEWSYSGGFVFDPSPLAEVITVSSDSSASGATTIEAFPEWDRAYINGGLIESN